MPKRKAVRSVAPRQRDGSEASEPKRRRGRTRQDCEHTVSSTSNDVSQPEQLPIIYPPSHADIPFERADPDRLRVVSWNVTSFRAILRAGIFTRYIEDDFPHIICLQETKMTSQAESELPPIPGYVAHWYHSDRKGYSGVAVIIRADLPQLLNGPYTISCGIGDALADSEGRVLSVFLPNSLCLVNVYVPNSGAKLARLQYRTTTFEPAVRKYLSALADKHHVIYCGDLNVAHQELDIHDSKRNLKSAGHTPEERDQFGILLDSSPTWTDLYRALYPKFPGYTYYSRRFGTRMYQRGKGWRLDYFILDSRLFQSGIAEACFVRHNVTGSDHFPLVMDINYKKFAAREKFISPVTCDDETTHKPIHEANVPKKALLG